MKNRRIKPFMSLTYLVPKLRIKHQTPVQYLSLAMTCISSSIGSCNFFFIPSKEVKIYFRPLFSLCKSHSPGSQAWEKRKVKTEPGSEPKFGALSFERREKPWEEDYKAQQLPVVTLMLQSQGAPYFHQEASNCLSNCSMLPSVSITREKFTILLLLWSSHSVMYRDGHGLFLEIWSSCYMRLLGVRWVKSDGAPGTCRYPSEQQSSMT